MREIPRQLPTSIIERPERVFEDTATGYRIAVANAVYAGRSRLMMVVLDEGPDDVVAVIVHPLEERDIESKIRSGRWKPWS